jgi:hypothetical protein
MWLRIRRDLGEREQRRRPERKGQMMRAARRVERGARPTYVRGQRAALLLLAGRMNVRRSVQEPEQQRQNSQHRKPSQPASGQWVFRCEPYGHDAAEYVTQLQLMRDSEARPAPPASLNPRFARVPHKAECREDRAEMRIRPE